MASPDRECFARPAIDRSTFVHLALLIALVVAVYFIRIDDLTIRGEESRRATVAMEMLATGDWVVPRQQGDPNFMSARPPLQSWAMAVIGLMRGQVDVVAVRVPSVVAILLTVLLVYGYSRTFLSGAGAFAAGAAYATMGQVMELGRLGETDAMFTLFVSGSLLLWHWGVTRGWRPAATWTAAWLCVALGMLTKGLQAPAYFVAAVGMYLLLTRQWRVAFSWSHALGIAVALIVVGAWQAPFLMMMGVAGVRHIFAGDVSLYLNDWSLGHVAEHYATFPLRVLGSLLPWSLVFLWLLRREVRDGIAAHRSNLLFLTVCVAVSLPTVWFVPGARTRFFMSMYPCLAVLVGFVIDRCTREMACRELWKQALTVISIGVAGFGAVVLVASSIVQGATVIAQPPIIATIVVAACGMLAGVAWWSRAASSDRQTVTGVLCIASFAAVVHAGLVQSQQVRRSVNTPAQMAALKEQLPDDVELVSLGPVLHLFAYYYAEPIERCSASGSDAVLDGGAYFCTITEPDFPYIEVARINCDRNESAHPQSVVIVGCSVGGMHAMNDRTPGGRVDAGPIDLWLGPAEVAADLHALYVGASGPNVARH